MAEFPLLKGTRLRVTRVTNCGMPVAGNAHRMVTTGFVRVTLRPEMRDAVNIEQTNAEGKVCVADRTAPERKWYNAEVELCQVNTGMISMFTGYPQVLNWDDEPVGFRDAKSVDSDFGVALEVWTSGRSEDDCPVPTSDAYLTSSASGRSFGYLLFGGTEWRITSDLEVKADYTSVTLSGITIPMTGWGRGVYNVIDTDGNGTAGRLRDPFTKDPHYHLERTPIAPPDATEGNDPEPLAVASIFTGPPTYYGASSSDVAPDQPAGS